MHKKNILFNLILLLLLLTITTTLVLADGLFEITSISGGNGISGFAKQVDNITIIGTISPQIDKVTLASPNIDCLIDSESNTFKCEFEHTFMSLSKTFQVIASGSGQSETKSIQIKVDNKEPTITATIGKDSDDVVINYEAIDPRFCSGLDRIEINSHDDETDTNTILKTIDLSSKNICTTKDELRLKFNGTKLLFVTVYDKMGFKASSTDQDISGDSPLISNLQIKSEDNDLTSISYNNPIVIDLFFDVKYNHKLKSINLNFEGIKNPTTLTIPINSYINYNETTGTYTYNVPYVVEFTDSNLHINFDLVDEFGEKYNFVLTKTFKLDNSRPYLRIMKTQYCDDDKCFIISQNENNPKRIKNLLTVYFGDSTEIISKQNAGVKIGGDKSYTYFNKCDGSICYLNFSTYCVDKDKIQLSLSPEIHDIAGNKINGSLDSYVICDAKAPSYGKDIPLESIKYEATNNGGLKPHMVTVGSTIKFEVLLKETVTDIISNINVTDTSINNMGEEVPFSKIIDGTCKKDEKNFVLCTYLYTNVDKELGGKYPKFTFNFKDSVGHTLNSITKDDIMILKYESDDTIPDCFTLAGKKDPHPINRLALSISRRGQNKIDYPIFAFHKLEDNGRCKNADIVSQNMRCFYVKDDKSIDVSDSGLFKTEVINMNEPFNSVGGFYKDKFTLLGGYADDVMHLNNNFQMKCELSLQVVDEDKVYTAFENETVVYDLEFANTQLGSDLPGKKVNDKIKELEQNNFVNSELLDLVNSFYASMSDICSIQSYSAYFEFMGISSEIITGVESGLKTQSNNLQLNSVLSQDETGAASSIFSDVQKGTIKFVSGFIRQACEWSTCVAKDGLSDDVKKFYGLDTDKSDTFGEAKSKDDILPFDTGLFDNVNAPNLKNSLLLSVGSLCGPAIVYHIQEYRDVNCNELACYKSNSLKGLSLDSCEQGASLYICEKVVGEVFELPKINIIKNTVDNFNSMMDNAIPNTLLAVYNKGLCQVAFKAEKASKTSHQLGSNTKDLMVGKDNVITTNLGFDVSSSAGKKALLYACEIPRNIGRILDANRKTSSNGVFKYPNNPNLCKASLECDDPWSSDCKIGKSSWLDKVPILNKISTYEDELFDPETFSKIKRKLDYQNNKEKNRDAYKSLIYKIFEAEENSNANKDNSNSDSKNTYNGYTLKYKGVNNAAPKLDKYQEQFIKFREQTGVDLTQAYRENCGAGSSAITCFNGLNKVYVDYENENEKKVLDSTKEKTTSELMSDFKPIQGFDNVYNAYVYYVNPNKDFLSKSSSNIQYDKRKFITAMSAMAKDRKISNSNLNLGGSGNDKNNNIKLSEIGKRKLNDDQVDSILKQLTKDENIKEDMSKQNELENRYKQIAIKQDEITAINSRANLLARALYNLVLKDYLSTASILDAMGWSGAKDIESFLDTYLDSDSLKDNLCRKIVNKAKDSKGDTLYNCEGSKCVSVFTINIEKIPYNYSVENGHEKVNSYIYATTYNVGPIDTNLGYNICFMNGDDCTALYKSNKKPEGYWKKVSVGQTLVQQKSFISKKDYNKVCFMFDNYFPKNNYGATLGGVDCDDDFCPETKTLKSPKMMLCRKITESDLNNGNPVVPEDNGDGSNPEIIGGTINLNNAKSDSDVEIKYEGI